MRRLSQLSLLAALLAATLPLGTLAEPEPANGDPTRSEVPVPAAKGIVPVTVRNPDGQEMTSVKVR